jgi:hypothetical protein
MALRVHFVRELVVVSVGVPNSVRRGRVEIENLLCEEISGGGEQLQQVILYGLDDTLSMGKGRGGQVAAQIELQ